MKTKECQLTYAAFVEIWIKLVMSTERLCLSNYKLNFEWFITIVIFTKFSWIIIAPFTFTGWKKSSENCNLYIVQRM